MSVRPNHQTCVRRRVPLTTAVYELLTFFLASSDLSLFLQITGNPSTSSTLSQKKQRRNVQAPEAYSPSSYTPATTPRKYRLKTPQERNNTLYKVKRQRNNDAVRKSRSKAKQLQMMKEKQLEEALLENKELKEKLRIVNERLSSCRCQN
ncbi:hypothetical protein KIN20_006421 [Parelaphostrongylus tenuis]|uniref:BZIP domain-containing protein n=1 Tax=Parelaphostrongylus tenuis TaxID=148309 RepID=A0AAD5MU34_PARTN|nr:hypothetical protein KIN20_006421 [Parelaphostrongylus tenuis]